MHEEFQKINKGILILVLLFNILDNTIKIVEDDDMKVDTQSDHNSEDIVEFVFEKQNKKLSAHRCVLTSKLPLFKNMLTGKMIESSLHRINVSDSRYEPYHAFIEFLYTSRIQSFNSKYLLDLLELSDKF